jgi:nitroreductase
LPTQPSRRRASTWTRLRGATILLAATELGLGSCWLGNIGRERIAQVIGLPEHFTIHTIIALGYPAEDPVSEDAKDSVKYYKDASGRLHVPKRTLEEIAFYTRYSARRNRKRPGRRIAARGPF